MDYGIVELFTYGATLLLAVFTGIVASKSHKLSDACIFFGFLALSLSVLITLFYYNSLILNGNPDLETIEKGLKFSDFIMLSPAISLSFLVIGFGIKLIQREY